VRSPKNLPGKTPPTPEVSDFETEKRRSDALRLLDSLLSSQTGSGSNSNDRTATPEQDSRENDLPAVSHYPVFEDQRQEMPEELYTWRKHQDHEVKGYGSFAAASEYIETLDERHELGKHVEIINKDIKERDEQIANDYEDMSYKWREQQNREVTDYPSFGAANDYIEKLDEQQISEYAKDVGKYMKELDKQIETAYEDMSYEWREHPSPEAAIYPSFGAALEQNERDIHVLDEHARRILAIRESGDPGAIQFVEAQNARMEQDHPGLYAYLQWKIRQLRGGVL